FRIDMVDGVGDEDRVAEEDRLQEPHPVIAERDGGGIDALLEAPLDHPRRGRRHEADEERAVGDAPPIDGLAHEALVHMVLREVAGEAGEIVDVAFADRLGEKDLVAERGIHGSHGKLLKDWIVMRAAAPAATGWPLRFCDRRNAASRTRTRRAAPS